MIVKFLSVTSILLVNYVVKTAVSSPSLKQVDRSLHVRSLPPINGIQSNIYEVYMEPYGFEVSPILASAVIRPNGGNLSGGKQDAAAVGIHVKGELLLRQTHPPHGPVQIVGNITGLPPGLHGFHVHQFGDIREGCTSCGEHFNPFMVPHAGKHDPIRHVGDLGNIYADANGKAEINIMDTYLTLKHGPRAIVGRAIVVHENADDLGRRHTAESVQSGSSGNRLACGIIALVN